MKLFLLSSLALMSISIQAQERDFGNLIPGSNFTIKGKTLVKEDADISNYEIKVTPELEEFTYKPNSIKTPRGVFKRKNEKLVVKRDGGKVVRINSLNFDGDGKQGSQNHQAVNLSTEGKVNSLTSCYQKFKSNFLGMKKNDSSVRCITITSDVCDYLKKNDVNAAMLKKINSCNEVLQEFQKHQGYVNKHTKYIAKNNIDELSKLDKKLTSVQNLYEIENDSLTNLSDIVDGYERAIGSCDFLEEEGYLEKPEQDQVNSKESKNTKNQ